MLNWRSIELTNTNLTGSTSLSRQALFPFMVVFTGILMITWTWKAWGDLIVDFGRELYVPWQLISGKVLYLDIYYHHGPLSPYFNALAFSLLGPSLRSLLIVNFAIVVTLCWLLYVLISHISDRRSALVCLFVFLLLFAFAVHANFNYLTPYSHEMTHGMLLSVLILYVFQRWLESSRPICLAGCGSLAGLLFSTRPEMFFAVVVAMTAGICLVVWKKQMPAKRVLSGVVLLTSCMLLVGLSCFALLCTWMPWQVALQGALGGWWYLLNTKVTDQYVYKVWAGTLHPFRNMLIVLLWFSAWLGILAVAIRSAQKPPVPYTTSEKWHNVLLLPGAFMCPIAVLFSSPFRAFSALPVLLGIVIIVGLQWLNRNNSVETFVKLSGTVVLSVFALLLLTRIILNVRILHYGFVLAMPGVLVLVVGVSYWIVNNIRQRGWKVWKFELIMACFLFVVIIVPHFWSMHKVISVKRFPVGQPPNQFLDFEYRAAALNEMLSIMETHIKEDETLAVWPEGAALNFLSRRPNHGRFVRLIYPCLVRHGEDKILTSYATHPLDFILLVHRNESEFGVGYFGQGYARNLMAWLQRNYIERHQVGGAPFNERNEFGMILFQRRDLTLGKNVHAEENKLRK
jgi:hypothetical protein